MAKQKYNLSKEKRKQRSERMKGDKNPMRNLESLEKMREKQIGNKYALGHKLSEQSKKKISEILKRKYKSGELISPFARMPAKYGKEAPNWRGGKTEPRKNLKYKKWHKAVLENDNFVCQLCKKKGGKLHAHHLKRWVKFPELKFDIHNGITLCKECHYRLHKKIEIDLRRAFIDIITKLAEQDKDILLITNDVGYYYFEKFREKFPKQFLNAGITEELIIGICAGLARMEKKPYYYSMIPFLLMRPYEFVRNDVAYQNLNVKLLGVQGYKSYRFLGESHNIYHDEDILLLAKLPNIKIYIPLTLEEAKRVIQEEYKRKGPAYIRL